VDGIRERISVDAQLAAIADRYWDLMLESSPTMGSLLGDHRYADRIESLSRAHEDEMIGKFDAIAACAESLNPRSLDGDDVITRAVLISEARGRADELRSRDIEFTVDPMLGIHMFIINYVPQLPAPTPEIFEAYLSKAVKVGGLFDEAIERHREGVASGRTPVHTLVTKVLGQLDAYLASPVEQDPFLAVGMPIGVDDATRAAWRERMTQIVETVGRPAFARYRAAIADDVLPAARPDDKAGICWIPDGDEVYARSVGRFTSLDLPPDQIHQIGLDETERLADEYHALGGKVLGTTDLQGIYRQLRTDPSLRFETAEQIIEAAQRAVARAEDAAGDWFGVTPSTPCLVVPMPDVGAEDQPLAFYLPPAGDGSRQGMFFVNLTEPETRTRYESEALAFHEGVPGHHFQLTIAQELEHLPEFRRHAMATAYVEGWGLYVERLADEMGLYSGDIERIGVLSFDSWRAGRLVVDTGIHSMGWSRQQAIDHLTQNSPQAPNNVVNEVDRYIGWPGQALAYKMGQREIFRLRDEARRAMGDSFDIKGFHDAVLTAGPVPLDVLGEVVRSWSGG
jgi:uncharacterized protein (DUF885 family)